MVGLSIRVFSGALDSCGVPGETGQRRKREKDGRSASIQWRKCVSTDGNHLIGVGENK